MDLSDITYRDLTSGDAGWVAMRHGELYARDEGYDITFEALVMGLLADFVRDHDTDVERAWIAVGPDGTRLGCIFCTRPQMTTAKLRMFLIEPDMRGTGLAQALLDKCMCFARETGADKLTLWTHESHVAAGKLYARNGFRMTATGAVESFGQSTVEQVWEREL